MGGVGVWHIYGHVFECYGRFSTLYARHTGIIDGEILETLWSILNRILESCRGMSLAHREEVISLYMSDSNNRKIVDMGASRCIENRLETDSQCSRYISEEIQEVSRRDGTERCFAGETVSECCLR